jgi:hypothetical protein
MERLPEPTEERSPNKLGRGILNVIPEFILPSVKEVPLPEVEGSGEHDTFAEGL